MGLLCNFSFVAGSEGDVWHCGSPLHSLLDFPVGSCLRRTPFNALFRFVHGLFINQSFISHNNKRQKNTENTISTNGRYNQVETALIVDLKTHINQLQSYNNGSLAIAVKTQCCSELWNLGNELKSLRSADKPFRAFMTLSAKKFDLTEILLWCLKSL